MASPTGTTAKARGGRGREEKWALQEGVDELGASSTGIFPSPLPCEQKEQAVLLVLALAGAVLTSCESPRERRREVSSTSWDRGRGGAPWDTDSVLVSNPNSHSVAEPKFPHLGTGNYTMQHRASAK